MARVCCEAEDILLAAGITVIKDQHLEGAVKVAQDGTKRM